MLRPFWPALVLVGASLGLMLVPFREQHWRVP